MDDPVPSNRLVWLSLNTPNVASRVYHWTRDCYTSHSTMHQRIPTFEHYAIEAGMRLCSSCARGRVQKVRAQ